MAEPFEILAGPFVAYLAPDGTIEPLDLTADPADGPWEVIGVGGAKNYDEDGVTISPEESRERFRGLAEQLVAGEIGHGKFRYEMGKEVKRLQTQAAILGAGGQGNMTDNQRRLLDRSVKDQLAYLDGFVRDIREHVNAGKPVPQRMISRAGSYAAAASVTADQARRQSMADEVAEDSADLWEVRVLGVAEHCNDCVEYAGRPAPVGTLPPIGDSECGQYCKCRFEYGPREELERKYGRGAS